MSWGLSLLEWSLALLAFGAMSFLASPAHASELEMETAAADAAIAGQRAQLERSCGGPVRLTVDWASFESAYVDSFTAETAAAYCGEVVRAVADACATTPALRPQVKGVACRHGKPDLRAKNGSVDATFDWEGFGLYDDSRQLLHGVATKSAVASKKKAAARGPKS